MKKIVSQSLKMTDKKREIFLSVARQAGTLTKATDRQSGLPLMMNECSQALEGRRDRDERHHAGLVRTWIGAAEIVRDRGQRTERT
jgi:hypothetical protein